MCCQISLLCHEKCFKLNAARKFFDILSGGEFVGFLEYGTKLRPLPSTDFSAFESGRFYGSRRRDCPCFVDRKNLTFRISAAPFVFNTYQNHQN